MNMAYRYVGPKDILEQSTMSVPRKAIVCKADVFDWIDETGQILDGMQQVTATFIVDSESCMWIADRRSEHVVCARGEAVQSAGEITFSIDNNQIEAVSISNQSTGYCPEPQSWGYVRKALSNTAILFPNDFTQKVTFRRCDCGQINIVKDNFFVCDVCGEELPPEWNFIA